MNSSLDWVKGLVRAFSALTAMFFYVAFGFRGETPVGSIPMLLMVVAAGAVAFAPEAMLSRQQGRNSWILILVAGLLGSAFCLWDALMGSASPDNRFAIFSAIGMLSLAIGFTRLLPDRPSSGPK